MDMIIFFPNCFASTRRRSALGAMLALVLMLGQVAIAATTFVTLNDGRLQVFPDTCLKSMTTDDAYVTFTANDGSTYRYALDNVQAIGQELTKELPAITAFKIDDKYNHQVISDGNGTIEDGAITMSVLGIGKWLTPTFTVSDDNALVTVDAVAQHSNVSRLSFATTRVYTVGYQGDQVLAPKGDGHYDMQPFGRQYTVQANFLTDGNEEVPRIDINTVGGENISSRDYYLDAEIIIDGKGIFPSMTDSVQIKGRGHSSWSNNPDSKNPYRLKFDHKVKPLGLTKGKSWVLLANKMSASMLTNAIAQKAGSIIGTPAACHIIPVDLYINGTYKGSYNFTEKIGFSNNSIDLDDESAATLLELDINYDAPTGQKFQASPTGMLVNVHEPDFKDTAATVLNLKAVKARFNQLAAAVMNDNHMTDHVDADYIARYLMLNELTCNYEVFHPKSVWCYNENVLDDSAKFIFGPVWDFDWAFGYETHRNYYMCNPAIDYYTAVSMWQQEFFTRMRFNPEVARHLYEHCRDFLREGIDELCDYCTEYYAYAEPSIWRNRYHIGDYTDYAAQAVRAANWLRDRANAMYQRMKLEVVPPGDLNDNGVLDIGDVTLLIDYLLSGSDDVDTDIADVDTDGIVSINDVTALIDMLLSN